MKMFWQTRKTHVAYRQQALKPASVLAVQQADDGIEYVLARPQGDRWQVEEIGFWEAAPELVTPLDIWQNFFERGLGELLEANPAIQGRRLLLGVRRPVIEFCRLEVVDVAGIDRSEHIHNQLAVQERLDSEEWVIDYACMAADDAGLRQVFAASLPRDVWERWQGLLQASKCRAATVVPRAWAVLAFVRQQIALEPAPTLLVAVYRRQADLMVLSGGSPVFVRSLNLQQPEDPAAVSQQLLSEIRLTAGTIDLPGEDQAVTHALVLGDAEFTAALATDLTDSLDMATRTLDLSNLSGFRFPSEESPAADVVPLLGLLVHSTQAPDLETIDLMNPKQIFRPASPWKRLGWIAALLLAVLGYFAFDLWQTYAATQADLQTQADELKQARATLERTLPRARVSDYLQRWESEQVDWLRQLAEITARLPSGDDVVVRQYDAKRTANGADISLQFQARSLEAIAAIDRAISESGWQPQFRRVVETQDPAFPFRLEATIPYTQPLVASDESTDE